MSLALLVGVSGSVFAQKKGFDYKFYGQVRTDLFYNTRSNSETVDGLFYMYPLDENLDPNGHDLNGVGNGNFYTLYTRLGVDVTGPMLGKAKTSAKVEVDFRGSGTTYSLFRIRHVYFNLDWGKSALLVGQTWHPLYGDVAPEILNLNMGAPYQPFRRAPQIRYRFTSNNFMLTAAAKENSEETAQDDLSLDEILAEPDMQNILTEEDLSANQTVDLLFTDNTEDENHASDSDIEFIDTQSETEDAVYFVNERVTGISGEAHVKYTKENWLVSAKTVLGTNLTQTSTVGGYGITSIDEVTGKQQYSPLRTSSTWVNVAYGKKWRPALFFGYLKNLGATKEVPYGTLGTGTTLDQLFTGTAELTYNIPHWKFGAEYSLCNAWYGDEFDAKAKAINSHSILNHRIVLAALFQF